MKEGLLANGQQTKGLILGAMTSRLTEATSTRSRKPLGARGRPELLSNPRKVAMAKPTIPEVLDRFRAYRSKNPAWGSLHVVLYDNNVQDCFVRSTIEHARVNGDAEGEELANILLQMSRTQRLKIGTLAMFSDKASGSE